MLIINCTLSEERFIRVHLSLNAVCSPKSHVALLAIPIYRLQKLTSDITHSVHIYQQIISVLMIQSRRCFRQSIKPRILVFVENWFCGNFPTYFWGFWPEHCSAGVLFLMMSVYHCVFTHLLRLVGWLVYSCCSHFEHRASVKRFHWIQFLNLRHLVRIVGRIISPSQGCYLTQIENKHRHMAPVGFESTIPEFERAKTVHALERAAIVIG
jgi:hypothetical protein